MTGDDMKAVLVVSADKNTVTSIRDSFSKDVKVESVPEKKESIRILSNKRYDLVFFDINSCEGLDSEYSGEKTVGIYKQLYPTLEIVVIANTDNIRFAFQLIRAGARDYLVYPFESEEVALLVENIGKKVIIESELDYLRGKFWNSDSWDQVQTRNLSMKTVFEKIRQVAPTTTTVLLTGETGTGKGVVAKLIHRHSQRENAQFVSVHCGAMPDTLLESELFGHEKGAFTGAMRRKLGKFEIAGSGTIFLDEIGTITPSAQVKLLQVLQDGTFFRVGGEDLLHTNCRIIVATNEDLKKMCENKEFRKDLYYRLNIFPVELPPLRERTEDIPGLIQLFLTKLNNKMRKNIQKIDPHVIDAMKRYSWPGNIREMENIMERAYILEKTYKLSPANFPPEIFGEKQEATGMRVDCNRNLSEARQIVLDHFYRHYLIEILTINEGKINKSAKHAGISSRQLHKLMLKYNLKKESFKKNHSL